MEPDKIQVQVFKSDADCNLAPFSFFKSKHYLCFRLQRPIVYRMYFQSSSDLNNAVENQKKIIKIIQRDLVLKSELEEKVREINKYLESTDEQMRNLGLALFTNFIEQLKQN
jgi:hypothetical protein